MNYTGFVNRQSDLLTRKIRRVSVFICVSVIFMFVAPIAGLATELFLSNPSVRIGYDLPWYSFYFNDVLGCPSITYAITNQDTSGQIIQQAVFVVEVAVDRGDGSIPTDTDFVMLDYAAFANLPPGENKLLSFELGKRWQPQRYILRRSLYVFRGNSPVHQAMSAFADKPDVFAAWNDRFKTNPDWEKEMAVAGVYIIQEVPGTDSIVIDKHPFRTEIMVIVIGVLITMVGGLLALVWKKYATPKKHIRTMSGNNKRK